MNFDLTLAPGETKSINTQGNYFAVVFAPVDLMIRISGSEAALYSQGDSLELPAGQTFSRLEVRNPSATASVVVLIYAGVGRYVQRRQAVMEPPTEFNAWVGTQLNASDGQTFSGVPTGRRMRRKCIQVTNGDATLRLQLRDAAGNVGLEIFPETSITLPISETVEVFNPNGAAVACRVSEIWWLSA